MMSSRIINFIVLLLGVAGGVLAARVGLSDAYAGQAECVARMALPFAVLFLTGSIGLVTRDRPYWIACTIGIAVLTAPIAVYSALTFIRPVELCLCSCL